MSLSKIAEEAGVSKATVSLILNDKKSPFSFSDQTRQKVLAITKKLNYQPNHMAQSLSLGKSFCIGIAGMNTIDDIGNLCISRIWSGAGSVIENHKYNMMLLPLSTDYLENFQKLVRSKMMDGIIIHVYSTQFDFFNTTAIPFLNQEKIPFVAVHSTSRPFQCHNVGFDSIRAGYLATRHLIDQGISDISMVCYRKLRYNEELFSGYQSAMDENNYSYEDIRSSEIYDDTAKHGYAYCKKLLRDKSRLSRGYVLLSDYFAYGFLEALKEAGKRVPEDVSVVACDNSFKPEYFPSTLTTIDRQFELRGKRAAEFLFDAIDNKIPSSGHQTFIAQPELVVRQTSVNNL
jgi:DNA-binding LacI/PurR family transcriptional regulator